MGRTTVGLWISLLCASACTLTAGGGNDETGADAAASSTDAQVADAGDCPAGQIRTGTEITALGTGAPPVLDGLLDEDFWFGANRVEFSNPARSDNSVTIRIAWDETALYLGYDVADAQLETGDLEPHRNDGAELYLDVLHDATTSQNADDRHYITNIDDEVTVEATTSVTSRRADGYSMEVAVPWSDVGATPAADLTMGLLLGNNDRDGGVNAQFDWMGVIDIDPGSYGRPNLWGDLVISTAAACP